uniref:Membrane insertase YidC/Oxa/ALB C-terminal domain-containing protein n=1 Tax=Cairina moschata TaxID=8855 RepID=A0A8C3CPB4_CAIMO
MGQPHGERPHPITCGATPPPPAVPHNSGGAHLQGRQLGGLGLAQGDALGGHRQRCGAGMWGRDVGRPHKRLPHTCGAGTHREGAAPSGAAPPPGGGAGGRGGAVWGGCGALWGSYGVAVECYGAANGVAMGRYGAVLGNLWVAVGQFWGHYGSLWGSHGAVMGCYGAGMGCLWGAMGLYGTLWGTMRCYGSLWGIYGVAMGRYGVSLGSLWGAVGFLWGRGPMGWLLWVTMGLYGALWGAIGSLWGSMGNPWVSMGHYGALWGSMGNLWVTMGHYGALWGAIGSLWGIHGSLWGGTCSRSLGLGTLGARVLLLPLVLRGQREAARLGAHLPQLQRLHQRLAEARRGSDRLQVTRAYAELAAYQRRHDVHPLRGFLVPLVQTPLFVSFFLALQQMAAAPHPGLQRGGLGWFPDLAAPDPFYALPLLVTASTWLVLELGAETGVSSPGAGALRQALRVMPLLVLPFVLHFPTAVFLYWLTSNSFSLLQTGLLRVPAIRARLRVPAPPPPAPPTPGAGPAPSAGGMLGKLRQSERGGGRGKLGGKGEKLGAGG